MERLIAQLPAGIGYEWTEQSYEEQKAGSQTGPLYAISLTVILLCLAALYENWPIPISVMLVVPLGVMGGNCGRARMCGLRRLGRE
jgi:multidrug efflux pump